LVEIEASNEVDRESIFEIVRGGVGFHRVNSVVLEKMRGWVVSATESAVEVAADFDDEMGLKMALASLYSDQGQFERAEGLSVDCLEKRRAVLGGSHADTLSSMNKLANLYSEQGKYEQAEALYVSCLEGMRAVASGHAGNDGSADTVR
jgi:tetratricopeptide (TPR) repeat protein